MVEYPAGIDVAVVIRVLYRMYCVTILVDRRAVSSVVIVLSHHGPI